VGTSTQITLAWWCTHLAAHNGECPKSGSVTGQNGFRPGLKFFF
jgi:hypothetical protein